MNLQYKIEFPSYIFLKKILPMASSEVKTDFQFSRKAKQQISGSAF